MKPLFSVFMLLVPLLSFGQENTEAKAEEVPSPNTLEIKGFSVPEEVVSDSLTVANDSIDVAAPTVISRLDSLMFLSFYFSKPVVLKNIVLDTLSKETDSLSDIPPLRFRYMKDVAVDHDAKQLMGTLFIALLDSFSLERTQYERRLRKLRALAPRPIKEMDEVTIEDYKIFYSDGRVSHVDTTLTVHKDYRFNYLRRDFFELLPFANSGETYNRLGYDFQDQKITPQIGARAKHYGYLEEEEIPYFEVPSPLTELFFKTVFEQGQMVDALITVNPSPRLNLTFAHKAFRSLGKYINTLGGGTNLRFASQFTSKDYRYRQRLHFVAQRLENQANGGLDSLNVYYFEKAVDELEYDGFLDRSRLTNNIQVNNTLVGRRYHLDHQYDLKLGGHDKMMNYERPKALTLGHKITYEAKHFIYNNNSGGTFFGTVSGTSNFGIRSTLDVMDNEVYGILNNKKLGTVRAGLRFIQWDYKISLPNNTKDSDAPVNTGPYPVAIEANQLALTGQWEKTLLKFKLKGTAYFSGLKEYASQFISGSISKEFKNGMSTEARISVRSQAPNFNFYLHRSNYSEYNWHNPGLNNQSINSLKFSLGHPKWGTLDGQYELLDHYTYFRNIAPQTITTRFGLFTPKKEEELIVAPEQYEGTIQYLKLRFSQQLDFWKFSLANTAQYQQVNHNGGTDDFKPLNVPEWNVRSSFVFSSQLFNRALYLQTGLTAQYFSKYFADRYSAHLGEFAAQNHTEIGAFPRLDFFINAKIQQTRLFVKYEHFNSDSTGYNYYSAPFTPYRDGLIRFGLVWNFFQ